MVSVNSKTHYDCQQQHTKKKTKTMQDIKHWEEELARKDREKEIVVDRRKATRYLNQCCVCVVHRANAMKRPLCVCVFHYDYFPVASFFSTIAATTNIVVISSSTTTFKPHVPCLSLSVSRLSSNAQPEQQTNELIFSCSSSRFFSLYSLFLSFFFLLFVSLLLLFHTLIIY